jgi:hypothetical protein
VAHVDAAFLLPHRGADGLVERPSPAYRPPAGRFVRRYLALPSAAAPRVFVPAGSRVALREAIAAHRPSARAGLAAAVAPYAARVLPRLSLVVASATDEPPFPLAAAREVGLDPADPWYLWSPDGRPEDTLALFHVLGEQPSVVAVAHLESQQELVDAHLRGRAAAVDAGPVVAARLPGLIGAFTADGLPALATERVPGRPLTQLLRRGEAVELVDVVVDWLCDVAASTRAAPATLGGLRQRLRTRVVPEWRALNADADELDRAIDGVPATFAHGDLHPRNVIADGGSFRVIDVDRAVRHGFPLWDLWFFLADAYAVLDGSADRVTYFTELFGGRGPRSDALFEATRRVGEAAGVPLDAVPALATLCWLDLGRPRWLVPDGDGRRLHWLDEWAAGAPVYERLLEYDRLFTRLAVSWLEDPALGGEWRAWRAQL